MLLFRQSQPNVTLVELIFVLCAIRSVAKSNCAQTDNFLDEKKNAME